MVSVFVLIVSVLETEVSEQNYVSRFVTVSLKGWNNLNKTKFYSGRN
jgi:hypothetical protein